MSDIKFLKDITNKGQDGLSLLFKAGDDDLIVDLSGTALSSLEWNSESAEDCSKILMVLIDQLSLWSDEKKVKFSHISIDSDGVKLGGRIEYSIDDCKKICKL